jgi:streptomycin 3"-adenylyltransferase
LTAYAQVPGVVADYGHRLADLVASSSDGQLVGAYLHGSATLGGWVATRSDVDLLIVLRDGAPKTALTAVEHVLAGHGPGSPGTGLECSVVSLAQATSPRTPWPFLLHLQASQGAEPVHVRGDALDGDRDLLMHYFVCRSAAVPLIGPEPREVFGPVPRSVVLAYLADELRWGLTHAPAAYAVLNACRALILASRGDLVSKVAGGRLVADEGLGPADVIANALDQQQALAEPRPITPAAAAFVEQAIQTLDSEARQPRGWTRSHSSTPGSPHGGPAQSHDRLGP